MSVFSKLSTSDTYDPASRKAAITAGVLFLTATVTFLAGDTLIANSFSTPGAPAPGPLAAGVGLQALCAVAGAGIGFALLRVLSRYSHGLAKGYLAFRCLECVVIIAIGAYVLATKSLVPNYEIMIYGFTGTAGLMLSQFLYRAELVPTWLSWLGIVGYVAIMAAIPLTLMNIATLDSGAGALLYVPGGLFEVLLPILLIARGFRRTQTPSAPLVPEGQLASA